MPVVQNKQTALAKASQNAKVQIANDAAKLKKEQEQAAQVLNTKPAADAKQPAPAAATGAKVVNKTPKLTTAQQSQQQTTQAQQAQPTTASNAPTTNVQPLVDQLKASLVPDKKIALNPPQLPQQTPPTGAPNPQASQQLAEQRARAAQAKQAAQQNNAVPQQQTAPPANPAAQAVAQEKASQGLPPTNQRLIDANKDKEQPAPNQRQPEAQKTIEQLVQDALRQALSPIDQQVDEQKKLATEVSDAARGKAQADAMARLSAAGLGNSGALAGTLADTNIQASRDLREALLGIDAQSREEALTRALRGIDAVTAVQGQEQSGKAFEKLLAILDENDSTSRNVNGLPTSPPKDDPQADFFDQGQPRQDSSGREYSHSYVDDNGKTVDVYSITGAFGTTLVEYERTGNTQNFSKELRQRAG